MVKYQVQFSRFLTSAASYPAICRREKSQHCLQSICGNVSVFVCVCYGYKNIYSDFFKSSVFITSKPTEQSENSSNFKVRYLVGILGNQFLFLFTSGVIFYGGHFSSRLTWKKMTAGSFFFRKIQLFYSIGGYYSTSKNDLR